MYFGHHAARELLLSFIDEQTVIIAHGGHNDLSAMRWIHPLVIDTYILDAYEPRTEGGRSLRNLCFRLLNLRTQEGKGHDSPEDAAACRELVHQWILSIPG